MEITSDVLLKGTAWHRAIEEFKEIFVKRTNYDVFMLCLAIGIMYDKRIEHPDDNGEDTKNVPRNVIQNNDNGKLDFYFQAAVLSTTTEEFSEKRRLELAFGEKGDFNKIAFLTQFSNFGVTKLCELIGVSKLETISNLNDFLTSSVEGRNFEVDELPDEILLEEYE